MERWFTDVADGQYSFINYLTAKQAVSRYLDQLQRIGGENESVGVISLNEAGFLKIIEELKKQKLDSLRVEFTEIFDRGTTDFRFLEQLKNLKGFSVC